MDLGDPSALLSSILIGIIGSALLLYAKKNQALLPGLTGLGLCVFPYFVASAWVMWGVTGAALGGLYWVSKNA